MSVEECFEKGQLKTCAPDRGKALLSLKLAKENLRDAEAQVAAGLHKWAFIAAYTSMFHSAKALLHRDGIKERSHFCLFAYVKQKYRGRIEAKYLNEVNILREQRHRVMYGDSEVRSKEVEDVEAETAVALACGFLETVEKLLS